MSNNVNRCRIVVPNCSRTVSPEGSSVSENQINHGYRRIAEHGMRKVLPVLFLLFYGSCGATTPATLINECEVQRYESADDRHSRGYLVLHEGEVLAESWDSDADGILDSAEVWVFDYRERAVALVTVFADPEERSGISSRRFNESGQSIWWQEQLVGEAEPDTVATTRYDDLGRPTEMVFGTATRTHRTMVYGTNGELVREDWVTEGDGSIEERVDYSYDVHGALVLEQRDRFGDGSVDQTCWYSYDRSLNTERRDLDEDGDGAWDLRTIEQRGDHGGIVQIERYFAGRYAGTAPERIHVFFDELGREIRREIDVGADDVIDSYVEQSYHCR